MSENTESTNATENTAPVAPAAAPIPRSRVTRRVYVDHKRFGTCITLSAVVYCAPAGVTFAPKSAPKCDFTVIGSGEAALVIDGEGNEWVRVGENPGCGPRCPAALKPAYGAIWMNLSHKARKDLLASLAPTAAPAAPAPAAAE